MSSAPLSLAASSASARRRNPMGASAAADTSRSRVAASGEDSGGIPAEESHIDEYRALLENLREANPSLSLSALRQLAARELYKGKITNVNGGGSTVLRLSSSEASLEFAQLEFAQGSMVEQRTTLQQGGRKNLISIGGITGQLSNTVNTFFAGGTDGGATLAAEAEATQRQCLMRRNSLRDPGRANLSDSGSSEYESGSSDEGHDDDNGGGNACESMLSLRSTRSLEAIEAAKKMKKKKKRKKKGKEKNNEVKTVTQMDSARVHNGHASESLRSLHSISEDGGQNIPIAVPMRCSASQTCRIPRRDSTGHAAASLRRIREDVEASQSALPSENVTLSTGNDSTISMGQLICSFRRRGSDFSNDSRVSFDTQESQDDLIVGFGRSVSLGHSNSSIDALDLATNSPLSSILHLQL